jgi:cell pole-organizing protein PopZ
LPQWLYSKWKSGIEMAQPNVAREPSMEEILASIRRIIESNEPGTGIEFPADHQSFDEPAYDNSLELRSPPAHVPPAANQGFGQRQPNENPVFQAAAPRNDAAGEKSMSLADVAARVRAAADRNAAMAVNGGRSAEPSAPMPVPTFTSPAVAAPSFYGEPQQQQPRTTRPIDVRPLMAQAAPMQAEDADRIQASSERMVEVPSTNWNDVDLRRDVDMRSHQPVSHVEMPLRAVSIDIDEPKPTVNEPSFVAEEQGGLSSLSANLLSELAEQEIARSFEDLQSLFTASEGPSVEDMTREMLRPMLQDWLEDNLPTIVERLVREEISRVVRGSKR